MKILAFMQNMWVRDPQRIKDSIAKMPVHQRAEHRLRLIEYCLFAGCKSGRVLKKVFGPLCGEIIWEEASPEIAGDSKTICLPCPIHGWIVCAPHPAARQPDTIQKLHAAFAELNQNDYSP